MNNYFCHPIYSDMQKDKILVIGSAGQIGIELVLTLREKYGVHQVIASDIREPLDDAVMEGPFEFLNAMDKERMLEVIQKHKVTVVYHLAALLSATAEQKPELGWDLNMTSLFHVLNLAKEGHIAKIFWPSSIAVFGPTTPSENTPQTTVCEPTSVYGISKQAGERWCEYYNKRYGVDVRSIRYPGLIGYKSAPGGGTTDYAVDIFYQALEKGSYTSFLSENTRLPMMFMPDAIRATIELTEAPSEWVKIRSSYNLAGMSFTPKELAASIRKFIPGFTIDYAPDFRQSLADSWPDSIDDSSARQDWKWKNEFDLDKMTEIMLEEIGKKVIKA